MLAILGLLAAFIANLFKSRRRLEAEILFLRHQLNIFRQHKAVRRDAWFSISVPALKISRWRGPTVQYAFRLRRTAELRYRGQLAEGRTTPPPTNARREGDWVKPTFIGRSGQIGCYEQRITFGDVHVSHWMCSKRSCAGRHSQPRCHLRPNPCLLRHRPPVIKLRPSRRRLTARNRPRNKR